MLKAIVFGIATGAGVQAWRQWPADGPTGTDAALTVTFMAMVAAYLLGRFDRSRRAAMAFASATATATAVSDVDVETKATASNTVNVAVVMPGQGAVSDPALTRMEAMPWIGEQRREISSDELDGFDLAEFAEEHEHETA